jgi:hypothetical protein
MITLKANSLNLVTSISTKTWAELGFNNTNIKIVYLIDPPVYTTYTWQPSAPGFGPSGIELGLQYVIQPLIDIDVIGAFYEYSLAEADTQSLLNGGQLNVRTANQTKTWAQLGWDTGSSSPIDIVYLIDPPNFPTYVWQPTATGFGPTGIEAGKKYFIQPKINITIPSAFKAVSGLNTLPISSVMLTSFDEFGYDTVPIYANTSFGAGKVLNGIYDQIKQGEEVTKTDFMHMLDDDASLIKKNSANPSGLEEMVAWVNWFTYANNANGKGIKNPTTVQPLLQQSTADSIITGTWSVAGVTQEAATKIATDLKGSGTMNDASFVRGMQELQNRGYKVGLVPVIQTINPDGSNANYQNWRGYITFTIEAAYDAWALQYEAFIKHYINLCYDNGIILTVLYTGSEFYSLLSMDYTQSDSRFGFSAQTEASPALKLVVRDKFIALLGSLGLYAKTKFPLIQTTYASNWNEYNKLDTLWAHPGIDAIGIDWYFPIISQHTNDIPTLEAGVFTGEYKDYWYVSDNANQKKLSTTNKIGRTGEATTLITGDYTNRLKDVAGYKAHLLALGVDKPIIATELGVASANGSCVLPNVFPEMWAEVSTNTVGNIADNDTLMPPGHNLKNYFKKLSTFNLQIKDIVTGPYGGTFEMDQDHQYNGLKAYINQLNAVNILRHVVYTLDARPTKLFGAVVYNTNASPPKDEIYTYDTPMYPINHSINGKKAGGVLDPTSLLNVITPTIGNSVTIQESDASVSFRSFVSTDITDYEWGANTWTNYTPAEVNTGTMTINPNGNATVGNVGRFAYFRTMGTLNTTATTTTTCYDTLSVDTATIHRVPGKINFEAKGNGTITIVILGQSSTEELAEISGGRRSFTLTSTFQNYGMVLSPLYPQQEYVIGVLVNGTGTSGNVTATFKKNFCLILDQANLGKSYYRVRADANNLLGNAETEWYGWSDKGATVRKKYLQASAYSRLVFDTDATNIAFEYVRDFYNSEPKNILPSIYNRYGQVVAAVNGGIATGTSTVSGSSNNNIAVVAGITYTISGVFAGRGSGVSSVLSTAINPIKLVWLDISGNPIGGIQYPTNSNPDTGTYAGTKWTNPFYQITAPTGAVRMALQLQNIPLATDYKNVVNDSYTVYENAMIEKGAFNDCTLDGNRIPTSSDARVYLGETRLKDSGVAVFVNGVLHEYCNFEDEKTAPQYIVPIYAKQVAIRAVTGLPAGNKTVEIISSGRGTYLTSEPDPNIRRAGTYLRAAYVPSLSLTTLV